ncbi:Uncharacterized protein Fot_07059 [Forsythia ovata]|uniref:Uncharacterized protein n=1 Tax=Forsythia ovata TaxID=205694 RepID=A0ABD1WUQ7_9LAMI
MPLVLVSDSQLVVVETLMVCSLDFSCSVGDSARFHQLLVKRKNASLLISYARPLVDKIYVEIRFSCRLYRPSTISIKYSMSFYLFMPPHCCRKSTLVVMHCLGMIRSIGPMKKEQKKFRWRSARGRTDIVRSVRLKSHRFGEIHMTRVAQIIMDLCGGRVYPSGSACGRTDLVGSARLNSCRSGETCATDRRCTRGRWSRGLVAFSGGFLRFSTSSACAQIAGALETDGRVVQWFF